jgi:hypothetical protein
MLREKESEEERGREGKRESGRRADLELHKPSRRGEKGGQRKKQTDSCRHVQTSQIEADKDK